MEESERACAPRVFAGAGTPSALKPGGSSRSAVTPMAGEHTTAGELHERRRRQRRGTSGIIERIFSGRPRSWRSCTAGIRTGTRVDFEFINRTSSARRTALTLRYSALSDGITANGNWGCRSTRPWPGHSLRDLRELADERVLRFRDDVLLDSTRHNLLRVGLVGESAASPSSHHYTRVWGGWEWRREDFSDYAAAARSLFRVHRGARGIELGSVRFRVLEHFNSYARREDVDLSPTFRAGIVLQSGLDTRSVARRRQCGSADLRYCRLRHGLDSTRTVAQLTVVSQNVRRHTLIAHAEGGIVTHPTPGRNSIRGPYNAGRGCSASTTSPHADDVVRA